MVEEIFDNPFSSIDFDSCSKKPVSEKSLFTEAKDFVSHYFKKSKEIPKLTNKDEIEVIRKIKNGSKKALNILIIKNLRLVISIAKKYVNKGLSLLDLIQEGCLGLIKAVYKYDPKYGKSFSSYAAFWVRQAIVTALKYKSRTVRIPAYTIDSLVKVKNKIFDLSKKLGRDIETEEIAIILNSDVDKTSELINNIKTPVSYEDLDLEDELKEENVEKKLIHKELRQSIESALSVLNPIEKKIIKLRYGLIDGAKKTLKDVCAQLGITYEKARVLQASAMRKLRQFEIRQSLEVYMYS